MTDSIITSVRIFAELLELDAAESLAAEARRRLAEFGSASEFKVAPYWKRPGWFEVFLEVAVTPGPDTSSQFNAILASLGERWEQHELSDDEKWAIWDSTQDKFFEPHVRWANVEWFPKSCIVAFFCEPAVGISAPNDHRYRQLGETIQQRWRQGWCPDHEGLILEDGMLVTLHVHPEAVGSTRRIATDIGNAAIWLRGNQERWIRIVQLYEVRDHVRDLGLQVGQTGDGAGFVAVFRPERNRLLWMAILKYVGPLRVGYFAGNWVYVESLSGVWLSFSIQQPREVSVSGSPNLRANPAPQDGVSPPDPEFGGASQSQSIIMNIDLENGFCLTEFRPDDADAVVECLVDKEIHDRTLRIPFPYTLADAERWLGEIAATTKQNGQPRQFALRNEAGRVVGAVGLEGPKLGESPRAEIGYWLAKPYWGRGLMTVAARVICRHGFEAMGLAKITAHAFSWNDASARVLLKCGFEQEGYCRRHLLKDGQFIDIKLFGMLGP